MSKDLFIFEKTLQVIELKTKKTFSLNRAMLIISKDLPWMIVPFILAMFIIVESLDSNNWLFPLSQIFHQISTFSPY